ncbi:MAG: DUF3089 domain-containing protein [Myxococcota bacterium]
MRRRAWSLVVGLLLLAAGTGAACVRQIVVATVTPREPFGVLPPAPDYERDEAWSARPSPGDDAVADAFYVHPTTYVGPAWNGRVDDPTLNDATDRVATRLQASAFEDCCAVWAPRYRQANMTAFFAPSEDGSRALDVAYGDVLAAWRVFRARAGDRPFVLAAHSQGSWLAQRLLREEIAPGPARARLVAAWLPGMPITDPGVPACETPTQTGCVVSWNARGPAFVPGGTFDPRLADTPGICVNPLSWRADETRVDADDNPGAVFHESDPPLRIPAFADARCVAGTLIVTEIEQVPRDLPSRVLDRAIGPDNWHAIEYQAFFESIRANAVARVAAFGG